MAVNNGKSIYQLTSASALKDTDLFVISSADNLTRSVSLSQIRLSITKDFYSNDEINNMIDNLNEQIKYVADAIANSDSGTTDFRNHFLNQLQEIRDDFLTEINNVRSEFNTRLNNLDTDIDNRFMTISENMDLMNESLTTNINSVNTSLQQKITDLDTKLTNQINGLISYGTAVPTTLATGKVYLQYF